MKAWDIPSSGGCESTTLAEYNHQKMHMVSLSRDYCYLHQAEAPLSLLDMRKPCSRDKERKNYRTNGREIFVNPEDCFI